MKAKALFDNPKTVDTRRAPAAVVKELVDVYGMAPHVARSLPLRAAFARLYAFRRKAVALTGDALRATAAELSAELREKANDPERSSCELTDTCIAALAILDAPHLDRVAAGLANLLAEVAA